MERAGTSAKRPGVAKRTGVIVPTLLTVAMLVLLVGLGVWQLQRMSWKNGLLAGIAARAHGTPVSLDKALTLSDPEYARVRINGHFLNSLERHLLMTGPEGPGVHVITPFVTEAGDAVLVNRGFVPDGLIDPKTRPLGQIESNVEVIGLLRQAEVPGTFTPVNDPAKDIWYWRDAAAMLAGVAVPGKPQTIFIDQEASDVPGGWPRGGVTNLDLPNRHFEYALTWFAFAATLAVIYAIYMTKLLRPKPPLN